MVVCNWSLLTTVQCPLTCPLSPFNLDPTDEFSNCYESLLPELMLGQKSLQLYEAFLGYNPREEFSSYVIKFDWVLSYSPRTEPVY